MKYSRLRAIAWKESLHLLRDWRSLWLGIAIPLFQLFMFGYALSLDVNHVPLVVWDQSRTPESRDLLADFYGSRYFSIAGTFDNYRDLEREIDDRTALIALVIPSDFARRIEYGRTTSVQVILDGSDTNTAGIAFGYATAIVSGYSSQIQLEKIQRLGAQLTTGSVDLVPDVWFNHNLESKDFIVPGLIVTIMMFIGTLLISLTVAREWENGTMEQLISSPLTRGEIIIGKMIPYFALGMLDMAMCVVVGTDLFGVPFRGSYFLLFALASFFLIGTLGIGIWVSAVTKNQLVANQLAMMLAFLPSFLLSGFVYPISNMPKVIQFMTYFIPARYFIVILRGLYLKGIGLHTLAAPAALLTGFAVFAVALPLRAFKKRLT